MPLSTRKLLHQPLFPLYTSPHSSSSSSSSTNPPPFFPFHPPPSLATFPANLSSLLHPSQNTPHHPHPSKLLLILTLPILSLLLLLLLLLHHYYRSSTHNKNIQRNKGPEKGIESGRLVPPDSELSDSRRATSVPALEGSPELRPLTRHSLRRSYSSDELFYSAGGSQHHEVGSPSSTCSSSMPSVKPPPPPPPPVAQKVRKLKGLHWDKVRASSERSMVWDHLKLGSSFQLDEEKKETLFGCESVRRSGMDAGVVNGVVVVIDPKKSLNIAIVLRALNVTTEDVCDALLTGNTDSLGAELLETLLKMAPSKEEELKLKEYKDDSANKLGPAEKFLKAVLDVPFAFKRVDAMLYIASFDSDVSYLKKSLTTLELACKELRDNRLFRKLLDAVLKTGNRMNVGTNRGDAHAFKLDTLLKLVDIKGTDVKTTLLHFVVQEISRAEGLLRSTKTLKVDAPECTKIGLRVISKLGTELNSVKKAATIDSEVLGSYITKLTAGIGKVREVVRLSERRFRESMTEFLKRAEVEIAELLIQEGDVFSLVEDVTEYFHGDSAKEEAHPLRIFMVVRDFLTVLDQVCKEVGRVNERSNVISSEYFLGGWN